jgi:NAD+ kinase
VNALRRVGLVPHRDRPLAHTLALAAVEWFRDRDVEVRLPKAEAEAASLAHPGVDPDAFIADLDLVIFGSAATAPCCTRCSSYTLPVPILGVNAGQLGYLTALEPEELQPALPRLLAGDFTVSPRMMLEVVFTTNAAVRSEFALNEAVLERQMSGHLVRFDLAINGSAFTTYAADGVIVATPTGSTAYSFSVRGPIASPALRCLLLTPISPHMLFDRTLVLAEHEELEFVVAGAREAVCTMDGRHVRVLEPGDRARAGPPRNHRVSCNCGRATSTRSSSAKFALPDR